MRLALLALLAGCAAPEPVGAGLRVRLEVQRPGVLLRVEIANEGTEDVAFVPIQAWEHDLPGDQLRCRAQARVVVRQLSGEGPKLNSIGMEGSGRPAPEPEVLRPGERRSYTWKPDWFFLDGEYEGQVEYIGLLGPPIASNRVRFTIPGP